MDEETQVEQTEEVIPTVTEEETVEPSQGDPVAEELARVTKENKGRTKREKLEYTKARVESQLAELEVEEGGISEVSTDKSAPMTVAMYEQLEKEKAQKTALQLADQIPDTNERELTKYHLENTIKASGSPTEDLKLARAIVNTVKNGQIVEEVTRATAPLAHGSAPGGPATYVPKEPELTPQELQWMRPPFSLSKEQVIAARPK